jgi:hypothetical protein
MTTKTQQAGVRNEVASRANRYHIINTDTGETACGVKEVNEGTRIPAGGVPILLRCRRIGCRARWPKNTHA